MAKRIQRKGYIQFRNGHKVDIISADDLDDGLEIVAVDGLYLYRQCCDGYREVDKICSLKIPIIYNHLYKVEFYRTWTGSIEPTLIQQVDFDHIALFKPTK